MRYDHCQKAPFYLLLLVLGLSMLGSAWVAREQAVQIILSATGALFLLVSMSFRQLTVRDEGDRLLVSFGPLPLFRRRVTYANIESVERGRTTLLDGWGIHLSPKGGWTWNLWGFDCVTVCLKRGSKLHIGSDDAAALEAFLRQQLERDS